MAKKNEAQKQEIHFEESLEKLKSIVHNLESGELGLEMSVSKFEEGMLLAKQCQEQLQKAEQKIEILLKMNPKEVETEPFQAE